jgi:hypothetical protein
MVTLAGAVADWSSLYANHASIRSAVLFAHVAGTLAGGGAAIAEDRGMLFALRQDDAGARQAQVVKMANAHRVVILGLALVIASGFLLLAADLNTYLGSWFFWIKMAIVIALMGNGMILKAAERRARAGREDAWPRLRLTAMVSLGLWFLATLVGSVLPNVG